MAENHSQSAELPQWLNIFIYLLLVVILAVFGGLFVFIVGTLGVTIAFVGYFNQRKSQDDHH